MGKHLFNTLDDKKSMNFMFEGISINLYVFMCIFAEIFTKGYHFFMFCINECWVANDFVWIHFKTCTQSPWISQIVCIWWHFTIELCFAFIKLTEKLFVSNVLYIFCHFMFRRKDISSSFWDKSQKYENSWLRVEMCLTSHQTLDYIPFITIPLLFSQFKQNFEIKYWFPKHFVWFQTIFSLSAKWLTIFNIFNKFHQKYQKEFLLFWLNSG